jgi:hypothetical protein
METTPVLGSTTQASCSKRPVASVAVGGAVLVPAAMEGAFCGPDRRG